MDKTMNKAWGLVWGMLLAAGAAAGAHGAANTQQAQVDVNFLAARDAFRAGDAARLDKLAPALAGPPLAPYALYWQLTLRLDHADPAPLRRLSPFPICAPPCLR